MNMATIFNQHEDIEIRRDLRKRQTPAEAKLWNEIRDSKLGVKFRRQFGIGSYVVDFYSPRTRLVIEIDGEIHARSDISANDKQRQSDIENLGLIFLRFTNQEVIEQTKSVLERIRSMIQNPLLTKERAG